VAAGPQDPIKHLYLLDILRGLAALTVVVWHYQHFFFDGYGPAASFAPSQQPFYGLLKFAYERGYQAVPLFFVLSGFIFYAVYSDAVRAGSVSPRQFFVLRFSRLYPLHIATLLLVAVGQWLSLRQSGGFIVYPYNDLYHFILNIGFVSFWFEDGYSFNAPVWSVSLEIGLYALFYANMRLSQRIPTLALTLGALFVGLALRGMSLSPMLNTVGVAVACFYAGGLVFHTWRLLAARPLHRAVVLAASCCVIAILLTAAVRGILHGSLLSLTLFPTAVLALALVQSLRPSAGRSARLIGDISYSSYLLHFPVQLFAILMIREAGLSVDFYSGGAFLTFLVAVIAASAVSFKFFERPAQDGIRRQFGAGKRVKS
jgi:peptidoglycan/LPS O-acetylase OafA/YrhL